MIIRDKAVFFPEGRFTPVTGDDVYFSATDFTGTGQGTLTETTVFTTGVWLRSSGVASVAVYPLGDIDPSSIRAGDDDDVLTSETGETVWAAGGTGPSPEPEWLDGILGGAGQSGTVKYRVVAGVLQVKFIGVFWDGVGITVQTDVTGFTGGATWAARASDTESATGIRPVHLPTTGLVVFGTLNTDDFVTNQIVMISLVEIPED